MTFEKYCKRYPEWCHGCTNIKYAFRAFNTNVSWPPGICVALLELEKIQPPINANSCPCMTCLIKVTCKMSCKTYRDAGIKLREMKRKQNNHDKR